MIKQYVIMNLHIRGTSLPSCTSGAAVPGIHVVHWAAVSSPSARISTGDLTCTGIKQGLIHNSEYIITRNNMKSSVMISNRIFCIAHAAHKKGTCVTQHSQLHINSCSRKVVFGSKWINLILQPENRIGLVFQFLTGAWNPSCTKN